MKLLSVNAGSSTLKFRLYEMPEEKLIMKGQYERIGLDGSCYNLKFRYDKCSNLLELKNQALKGIRAFMDAIPKALNVACFDTAFHQTMDESTYLYPVPYEWYVKYDVRKYGFHGLSHKFITEQMTDILAKVPNLIICHIGSGCSITAVKEGKSIDTSMGFTPNAGIMMGTRSGDIDYSLINYVMQKEERNLEWVDKKLNFESGLQGIGC